ncbi:FtsQ-type POTRA domain-containing protein [Streptococcus sp. X16XC17]|uniref:cell division protein FtsQ/DivIB n=1 Tax=unclassified Streptococcus TaxID=2608887 RepID=UPI00066FEE78|nr:MULTISPECIES: FtsQ-type POTRA domain-containing protein [unclassified Streptococcus]TCD45988.1 FtsQ-type POTRA domain-containing protein [Streptococcus sp. X16XC17]
MTDKNLEKTTLPAEAEQAEPKVEELVEEETEVSSEVIEDEENQNDANPHSSQENSSDAPSDFLSHWQKKHQEYLEQKEREGMVEADEEEASAQHPALRHLQIDLQTSPEEDDQNQKPKSKTQIPTAILLKSLPVLFLAFCFLLLSLYFISPLSRQKEFTFKGNEHLSNQAILKDSLISEKDYAVTTMLNSEGHAKNIKNSSAWIKSATIHYAFPNRVTIDIEEYKEIGYVPINGAYYSVLSSGNISETATSEADFPEKHTIINLKNQTLVKKLVPQLAEVDDAIIENIQTIDLAPTKASADLLTLTMYDGNQILVPLSQVKKKLPYYAKIVSQLAVPSVIDMEVGIFSYAL